MIAERKNVQKCSRCYADYSCDEFRSNKSREMHVQGNHRYTNDEFMFRGQPGIKKNRVIYDGTYRLKASRRHPSRARSIS